jgi:hypothetical protein
MCFKCGFYIKLKCCKCCLLCVGRKSAILLGFFLAIILVNFIFISAVKQDDEGWLMSQSEFVPAINEGTNNYKSKGKGDGDAWKYIFC